MVELVNFEVYMAKQRSTRNPLFADEQYKGTEPVWSDKKLTDQEFKIALMHGFNYYNYFYSATDFKKEIINWLGKNSKLKPAEIARFRASNDKKLGPTVGALVRMHTRGAPLTKTHMEYIISAVKKVIADIETSDVTDFDNAIAAKKAKKTAKSTVTLVDGIQARMLQQARDTAGEIDGDLDDAVINGKNKLNVYKYLAEKQVSRPVASKIRAMYIKDYEELKASKKPGADPQLVEGYSNFTGVKLKRTLAWYDKMFSDVDNYLKLKAQDKKPRKRKVISADKLVGKLKYLKESKELGIASIKATDIVNAEQVWVFNVKTRKLGRYVAESGSQLSIKGTTILNFDAAQSVAKTLRKPKEQITEMMKAGKVNLRKYLDGIKATSIKLNGRINADTLLLRVA
jgi:hypothetical protein